MLEPFANHLVGLWVEAAPWLLVGLATAGLVRALIPAARMGRWLGGRGLGPITRAALIGTPLPLCSCSVLPAAMTIRRGGASRGATVSFLIATPENGIDSLFLSYAMLGSGMAGIRLFGALLAAIVAGTLTDWWTETDDPVVGSQGKVGPSLTSASAQLEPLIVRDCCQTASGSTSCQVAPTGTSLPPQETQLAWPWRIAAGLRYAFTTLLGDIIGWLVLGVVLAAVIQTFAHREWLAEFGSGPWAKLVMLVVGIPMYICASASTPLAAGLIASGVSPGTALVLLLAGPATNLGSVAIIRRELGWRSVVTYLASLSTVTIALGIVVDWIWPVWTTAPQAVTHQPIDSWAGVFAQAAALFLAAAAIIKLATAVIAWQRDQGQHLHASRGIG